MHEYCWSPEQKLIARGTSTCSKECLWQLLFWFWQKRECEKEQHRVKCLSYRPLKFSTILRERTKEGPQTTANNLIVISNWNTVEFFYFKQGIGKLKKNFSFSPVFLKFVFVRKYTFGEYKNNALRVRKVLPKVMVLHSERFYLWTFRICLWPYWWTTPVESTNKIFLMWNIIFPWLLIVQEN